ncbi:C40 family peptidase [Salisediminibacterium selenitireducens]|uniref:NLP/P60 protein n=1 Tax=Bacillus selenitireducens (strain ATCC 700615 / DSM 15326 / MLS10) TaxID=439292 RepID=D6XZK3_BACIE|nr:C40 family peptidase [Salisediminibacterium selenitireducens]ADH98377.1 NLP/P60 protein [[Bacillus] selenitireducens MLS10]
MKRAKVLISALIIAAGIFTYDSVAEATEGLENERDEVQSELDNIQSELSGAEAELAELVSEVEAIESEIEQIDEALRLNEENVEKTEAEIEEKEEAIEEMEDEIARLEADIEERMEHLKNRASAYQREGGPTSSYMEVLFGAEGFADFISRVFTVTQIAQADQDFIEQLEKSQQALDETKSEHESELESLEEERTELQGMIEYMEDQYEEQERLRQEVTVMQAEQEEMIASLVSDADDLEAREADLMNRIEEEQARAEEAAQSAAASTNNATASAAASSSGGASGTVDTIVDASQQYIGNSTYVFGGGRSQSDIANGRFDCSGFTAWAFGQIGIDLPANTQAQVQSGQRVSADEMQRGDLVFFDTYTSNGHVGIYLGNGQFLGSQSSTGVAVADMSSGYWAERFRGVVVRVM